MSQPSPSMSDFLRNRFIRAILLSGLLLQIGIWVRNFSILLFVVDKTGGNPVAVSLISVAEFAPIFIFSFIGGTFADRWRPKRTMVWCDILSAVSVFIVLFTLMFGSWKFVFLSTLVSAILSQFSQPSGMKLFKMHVPDEHMQLGMSVFQTMTAVFMIIGPVLGTFVYQNFGIDFAIGIMGVSFLLSAGVLTYLPSDKEMEKTDKKTTLMEEMIQGFRYVLASKTLTTLGGCFLAAGLGLGIIQPMGIFLVTERLGLSKEYFQWLIADYGISMIIGGVIAMIFAKKINPQKTLAISMIVNVIGLLVLGFSTQLWLTLIAQFISGLVMPALQISINSMILNNTEGAFVGRVNGILNPLFMGAMVLTMILSGWLKGMTSIVTMYGFSAALMFIGALVIIPLFQLSVNEANSKTVVTPDA